MKKRKKTMSLFWTFPYCIIVLKTQLWGDNIRHFKIAAHGVKFKHNRLQRIDG